MQINIIFPSKEFVLHISSINNKLLGLIVKKFLIFKDPFLKKTISSQLVFNQIDILA